MATVKTWKELEKALRQARDKSLKGTGEKATKVVKDRIDSDVYDAYSPEWYDRTYELKESVKPSEVLNKNNIAEIEISHDWFNMAYDVNSFQHASPYWSPWEYTRYVAETVHNGTSGTLFGESGKWMTPRPYMDNAKEEIKDGKYKKFMEEELNKMGIKTK